MARILVVDDEVQIRILLRELLQQEGYDVEEARNGEVALEIMRKKPVDLIIMDLLMPNKEGIETIREVHQHFPGLKIIAISGGGRLGPDTYLKMAKGMGALRTFKKPIPQNELLEAVRDLLNQTTQTKD